MNRQTQNMRYLTFALGKGRLAVKTLALLEKIGIDRKSTRLNSSH